jgi:hypothetical protein
MKYYRVYLSNKEGIVIDQADYQKLVAGMNTGSFVQLKNAVINPSFVSHILPIGEKEALETELPAEKIEGYIDEEKNVFVVTKDIRPAVKGLSDKFKM